MAKAQEATASTGGASETTDIRAMLAYSREEVEKLRPKALPDGHYKGEIINFEFGRTKSEKQTGYVRFELKISEPEDDVEDFDPEQWDLDRITVRKDQFITPRSMGRLMDFLDDVLGPDSRSADQRIPECVGVKVSIELTERLDRETGKPTGFNEVGRVVRL